MILYFLKNHFIYYNRSNSLRPPRPPPSRLTNDEEIKKIHCHFFLSSHCKKNKANEADESEILNDSVINKSLALENGERWSITIQNNSRHVFRNNGNLPKKLLQKDSNVKVYHLPNYDALFSQDGEKCGSWLWQKRKKV
jgi:hypothetical protein